MSIDQLPSWAYRACLYIDGRTHSATFPDEHEARDWESVTRAHHISGTLHGPVTVAQYASIWLEGYKAGPSATLRFHTNNLTRHILPAIGTQRLAKVTPTDITRLLVSVQTGVSAAKADSVYRTLSALFRSAEQDDLCAKAPTRSKKHRPRRQKRAMRVLERPQARELLGQLNGWQRDTALLQLALGARFGEIAGLTPHDVHGTAVTIERRVSRENVRATKNHRRRTLELPRMTLSTVERLVREALDPPPLPDLQDKEWPAAPWKRRWLIQTATGAPPNLSAFNKALKAACTDSKIPIISSHGLRHTYVSWMIDEGYSADKIAFWIGDTPQTVQAVYSHMLEDSSAPAAALMDEALAGLD